MVKDYRQFCGLAKASSVLGERWALLVVRDLMVSPRRFGELLDGLPGLTTNVLTARLRELELFGVVERRPEPLPQRGVVYTLTEYGTALGPILDALGLWGARRMTVPDRDDTLTDSALAAALRASFVPRSAAKRRVFVVRAGPAAAWANTVRREIRVGTGPIGDADLTVTAVTGLRGLLAGTLTPAAALERGDVEIDGPRDLLEEFARTFRADLDTDAP